MNDTVNETIDAVCIWIQKELGTDKYGNAHDISEMIKALAELVSARAGYGSRSFAQKEEIMNLNGITIDLPIHDTRQEAKENK